jgi:HSP20 family protein
MANVNIQKTEQPKAAVVRAQEPRWEPFRTMRELLAWDPFREMMPAFPATDLSFVPSFDVKETKDGYVFTADVPGIAERDIEVTLTGSRLAISGKRQEEKKDEKDTYYTYERSYGSFARAFTLPEGIDASSVHADLTNGVLTISIKKTPGAEAKAIPIATKKG